LSIVEELAKTGEIRFIVIDSVAALVPKAEVE
jgi:RecA/RadA recombinase